MLNIRGEICKQLTHGLDMLYFERNNSWSFCIGFVLWAKLLYLCTVSHICSKMGLYKTNNLIWVANMAVGQCEFSNEWILIASR